MERPTCATCPFWELFDEDGDDGNCHRNPPTVSSTPNQEQEGVNIAGDPYYGWFPVVSVFNWCGEHPDFPDYIASLKAKAAEDPAL